MEKERPFFQKRVAVIEHYPNMTKPEIVVYDVLLAYKWRTGRLKDVCALSISEISDKKLKWDRKTVRRALEGLLEINFVKKVPEGWFIVNADGRNPEPHDWSRRRGASSVDEGGENFPRGGIPQGVGKDSPVEWGGIPQGVGKDSPSNGGNPNKTKAPRSPHTDPYDNHTNPHVPGAHAGARMGKRTRPRRKAKPSEFFFDSEGGLRARGEEPLERLEREYPELSVRQIFHELSEWHREKRCYKNADSFVRRNLVKARRENQLEARMRAQSSDTALHREALGGMDQFPEPVTAETPVPPAYLEAREREKKRSDEEMRKKREERLAREANAKKQHV